MWLEKVVKTFLQPVVATSLPSSDALVYAMFFLRLLAVPITTADNSERPSASVDADRAIHS
jgi:hypothetical protein